MTPNEQFQVLNLLDYLDDLFSASPKETFTREEMLTVIRAIHYDQDFFAPEIIVLHSKATERAGVPCGVTQSS